MSIRQEELRGDVWLVSVSGRLDQGQTAELETTLQELLEGSHNELIIDLAEVSYVNSGGLRCLVTAWRQARKQGGETVLCHLSSRLSEVFNIVGFDKVFRIFPTRDAALEALIDK